MQKLVAKLRYELFQETEYPCNLRNDHTFRTCNIKTVQYGAEMLFFMGPNMRPFVPFNIKR